MSLTISEKDTIYAPISEGLHEAICIGLYDLGVVYDDKFKKSSEKVIIQWELIDETYELDGKELRRTTSKTFTKSFNEKSNLRKTLKSWRGRDFTAAELDLFDLRNILGTPCQLQISHSVSGDKTYANIDSVVSFGRNKEKPVVENTPFAFDLDAESWEADLLKCPEWIQERVKRSETYAAKMTMAGKPVIPDEGTPFPNDDDVPF